MVICVHTSNWVPSPLRVEAAVEGVYDDHTKRSEYTAYLVKSHQKFQDARLQVGAVQTAVNR